MADVLVNRVAQSSLVTLNLEDYYPEVSILNFDIKNYLFQGLILKEKDFRTALKEKNWDEFEGKVVCIYCSTDAIIPVWAYMLVASYMTGIAVKIYIGDQENFLSSYYNERLSQEDFSDYQDARIVIKGCSNRPVPSSAYARITELLKPYAQSIMYGEPCSTVPIYKRPRSLKK